jgi:hypothetical protein
MLISEIERFRQTINADQRHGSFSANFQLVLEEKLKLHCRSVFTENQPLKSYLFQTESDTDVSEQGSERKTSILGWLFTKVLVFMTKTGTFLLMFHSKNALQKGWEFSENKIEHSQKLSQSTHCPQKNRF